MDCNYWKMFIPSLRVLKKICLLAGIELATPYIGKNIQAKCALNHSATKSFIANQGLTTHFKEIHISHWDIYAQTENNKEKAFNQTFINVKKT